MVFINYEICFFIEFLTMRRCIAACQKVVLRYFAMYNHTGALLLRLHCRFCFRHILQSENKEGPTSEK